MKKFFILLIFVIGAQSVFAETIWCKTMKLGCTTPEERAKAMERCERLSNETYRDGLAEATADPTIWQYAGMNNAYEYAAMRKRSMMSICIKKSPELRN